MKPILFNMEMVKALLEGRKTVTRRVVKPQPPPGVQRLYAGNSPDLWRSPGTDVWIKIRAPYRPGDILWVRETWAHPSEDEIAGGTDGAIFLYRADVPSVPYAWDCWRPSIHMPKEAARIFLRVTGIRVERLQEIDDDDVVEESLEIGCYFEELWDRTIKPADRARYGWEANPWVWVIAFERIDRPPEGEEDGH